jgi:hypothetical protein
MNFVRLLPVFLSALLMAAHFSRADNTPLALLSLAFPVVLMIRRPWAARLTQIALVLGALEWVRTTVVIAGRRQAAGESWTRMAVILSVVAVVTLASVAVFRNRGLRERYGLGGERGRGAEGQKGEGAAGGIETV